MSVKAVGWALEQPLDPRPKVVLIALADAQNTHTGLCCPNQSFVAEIARCSVRSVRDVLKALEDDGYIARSRRFNRAGNRISDTYSFPALGGESLPADSAGRPESLPEVAASGGPAEAQGSGGPTNTEPEEQNQKIKTVPPVFNATTNPAALFDDGGSNDELVEEVVQKITEAARARGWRLPQRKSLMKLVDGYRDVDVRSVTDRVVLEIGMEDARYRGKNHSASSILSTWLGNERSGFGGQRPKTELKTYSRGAAGLPDLGW